MNINYDIASKIGYIGGMFVIFLTGLALIIVGAVRGYLITTDFQILSIPLSLGIALLSIGIAMHSCKISEESKNIANETDRKIELFLNSTFMEISGYLDNMTKQSILNIDDSRVRIFSLWSWGNSLLRAEKLKKWVPNQNERDSIVSSFIHYIDFLPWGKNIIKNYEVIILINSFLVISSLNPSKSLMDTLKKLFKQYIGDNAELDDFYELIGWADQQMKEKNPSNNFKKISKK